MNYNETKMQEKKQKNEQYYPILLFLTVTIILGGSYLYGVRNENYDGTGYGFFFAFLILPITMPLLYASFMQTIIQVYRYHKRKDPNRSLILNILNWIIFNFKFR